MFTVQCMHRRKLSYAVFVSFSEDPQCKILIKAIL